MREYTLEEAQLVEELTDRWSKTLDIAEAAERELWTTPIKKALHALHQRLSGPPCTAQELRRLRSELHAQLFAVAEPLEELLERSV